MFKKEDKEVQEFLIKGQEIAIKRYIEFLKEIGLYKEKYIEQYKEEAIRGFKKQNVDVDFSNHSLICEGVDLSEFADKIKDLDDHEEIFWIAIDKDNNKVIDSIRLKNPDKFDKNIEIQCTKFILNLAEKDGNFGVVSIHNHPSGAVAKSSTTDKWTFMRILILCRYLRVELLDCYVVTRFDVYSEKQEDSIREQGKKLFPVRDISDDAFDKLSKIDIRSEYLTRLYLNQRS